MSGTAQTESHSIDALLPGEMALKAERIGAAKTRQDVLCLLTLGVLAGAFIAFGVVRLLSGLVFSLGLILVVVGGAELFTGNNLIVMAWAGGKVRLSEMLRAWAIVYIGNFIGAAATAIMVFLAGTYALGGGAVGVAALATAEAKAALPFTEALFRGILCNVLVCLAVWLCYSARSTTDKILAIIPPITAFVAAGFEHSIANMYFLPFGLAIKGFAPDSFWAAIGQTPDGFAALDYAALATNLIPVTIGNVIGGVLLVGVVYWFIYLRVRRSG